MRSIAVIVPIFNEEGNIWRVKSSLDELMHTSSYSILVVFVNDGSTDNSLLIIKSICSSYSSFKYISFEKNQGLSAAIKAGFDRFETRWVAYLDADLQTNPMDFLNFESFLDDYELITGERQNRQDGWQKKVSSKIANWVRIQFLQDGIKDSGCPLKIFKRDFAASLPYFDGFHRFFPALTQIYGGSVKVIPVQHYPRLVGKSKFNISNRLVRPFLDILLVRELKRKAIKSYYKSSRLPLIHE